MRTSWGSATDKGVVRAVNEDAVLTFPPLFLVADGMGGHDAGDLAARIAVEEFAQLAGQPTADVEDITACFERTAARIRAEFTHGRQGGTTVSGVALSASGDQACWLAYSIGDSRVYRVPAGGELEQVSVDHSVVQDLVDRGELSVDEAARHPERHVLTRALGTNSDTRPDFWMLPAQPGDRVLVCTDGLTRELTNAEIEQVLAGRPDAQQAATAMVAEAVARGARDNVSVVVVDMVQDGAGSGVDHSTAPGRHAPGTSGRGWDEIRDGVTVPRPVMRGDR